MTKEIYAAFAVENATFASLQDLPNFERPASEVTCAWGFECGTHDVMLHHLFEDNRYYAVVWEVIDINGKPGWGADLGRVEDQKVDQLVALIPASDIQHLTEWREIFAEKFAVKPTVV